MSISLRQYFDNLWPYLTKVLGQNFGAELVFTENASTSQATRIPTATQRKRCQFVNLQRTNVLKELSTRIELNQIKLN